MLDEVKIVESSKFQVFSNPFKTEISIQTLSGPTQVNPKFKFPSQKLVSSVKQGRQGKELKFKRLNVH
jgi:hypothetical protein